MLRSNFSTWQENCVDEKTRKVISILKDMSEFKTPAMKVTDLAKFISDKMIKDLEGANSDASDPCVLDFTTLLRKAGKYRPIIDSYMLEREGFENYALRNIDPIIGNLLESHKVRLKQSNVLVKRLQEKVSQLEADKAALNSVANIIPNSNSGWDQLNAMGKVASIFFDLLLSTDYCKFDEATGDLLAVGRARRVLLPASDIAVYLNWRYRAPSES
ncbi:MULTISPECIES: hypothetical protein [Pseudomonas]|uniref:Uncharacterized protein n=1 Tax=Pseudomonas sp. WC2401 TaxID=3234143 RepID=A0AB39WWI2_9PSED